MLEIQDVRDLKFMSLERQNSVDIESWLIFTSSGMVLKKDFGGLLRRRLASWFCQESLFLLFLVTSLATTALANPQATLLEATCFLT